MRHDDAATFAPQYDPDPVTPIGNDLALLISATPNKRRNRSIGRQSEARNQLANPIPLIIDYGNINQLITFEPKSYSLTLKTAVPIW